LDNSVYEADAMASMIADSGTHKVRWTTFMQGHR